MSAVTFPTLANVPVSGSGTPPDYIFIEGYYAPGDGGASLYELQRSGDVPRPITDFPVLGSTNLFTNSAFTGGDTTGWTLGSYFSGDAINNRLARAVRVGGEATTTLELEYGKRYRLAYGATRQSAGGSQMTTIRSTVPNSSYPEIPFDNNASSNASTPYPDFTLDYPGSWKFVIAPTSAWGGYFDNFTCYEVIDQGQKQFFGYAYLPVPLGARLDLTPAIGGYLQPEMFGLDDTGTGYDDAAFSRMFNRAEALGGNVGIKMPGRYRRQSDGHLRAPQSESNIHLDAQEPGDWGISAALWVTPDAEDSLPGLTAFANYLIAQGGEGYVPAGTYKISGGWQFQANNGNNKPFRVTFLPGAIIEGWLTSQNSFVTFWELNDFEVVGLNINGRATENEGRGGHGICVRDCSNWKFSGKTKVVNWSGIGEGGGGFLCYATVPNDVGTFHHGFIEDIELVAAPGSAGLGVLIDSAWYVDVMKAYAENIDIGLGYAFEYKDSCRHSKFHFWRAKNCKYALGYGQQSPYGAQYADFGEGEAVNCQNLVLVDNAQYCSIGPATISVDPSRSDDNPFIRIGGAARNVVMDGVAIYDYPAGHDYPIYIEGSDSNSLRVTQISGASRYWHIHSGEENRIVIEMDTTREGAPDLTTFASQTGDSANNVARVDVLATQWWRDGNVVLLGGDEFSSKPAATSTASTLGAPSSPWRGLYASQVDIMPSATEPSGSNVDGMIGASDGTAGGSEWGGAGAGLYRWDGTAGLWRYLAGPRTPVVLGQSGAASATLTGSTTETTLATITVPSGWMGNNGALRITTLWTVSNTATTKRPRVRFGGTLFANYPATTSATLHLQTVITNRNEANSQVAHPDSLSAFGASTNGIATGAIDTTSDQQVNITGLLADPSDSMTLQSYTVELLPAP